MTKTATDLLKGHEVNNPTVDALGEQILELLTNQKLTLQELYGKLNATENEIDKSVRTLLILKYITENSNNKCSTVLGGEQYLENQ